MLEPRQQRLGLLDLAAVDRRRLLVELGDEPLHALAHPWPVLDRRAHVAQHAHEAAAQRVELVGLAVDLDVHDRLCQLVAPSRRDLDELAVVVAAHVDDRVHEQVDAVAVASELQAHRVHEEQHVVTHDLDDRVRRLPAVLLELRVADAHLPLAGRPAVHEVPVRQGGPVDVQLGAADQVLGGTRR